MAWTGVQEDGGRPEREESMRQDGEQRDTGQNPIRTGTHGHSGDRDKEESMTTGMEGKIRIGEETEKEKKEGKTEAGDTDQRETVGDYGR